MTAVTRCLLHHVRLVMSVVLFSVFLQRRSPARAHGFYSVPCSFCRLTLYGLSLLVRTRNALQNELTMLSARAHLIDIIYLETTHCDKQFFLQADSLPTHQNGQSLAKP